MLQKTKGIVLKVTDFSDTSIIVQIFTEIFGIQSYIIQGAKKPKAKIRTNMLQPLQLVEMVVKNNVHGGLNRISQLQLDPAFVSIPYDILKSSLALFTNEILYKTLKHQGADPIMFQFIRHTIQWLDHIEEAPVNFHLHFLIKYSKYLGFYPSERLGEEAYFDLKNGYFSKYPNNTYLLQNPHTTQLNTLMKLRLDDLHSFKMSNEDRRFLLNKLLEYYKWHLSGFGEINSHQILEEVLS